jgi:hypothetical protein
MRVFHTVVFDDTVEGASAYYTSPEDDALLGTADALSLYGYAAQVTGTANLTVQVEQGPDSLRWTARNGTAEVNALSLSTTAETPFSANDGNPANAIRPGFARLRIQLSGTNPRAKVKIWVTGRGEQGDITGPLLTEQELQGLEPTTIGGRGLGPERNRGSTNGTVGITALTQANRDGSR